MKWDEDPVDQKFAILGEKEDQREAHPRITGHRQVEEAQSIGQNSASFTTRLFAKGEADC